MEQPHGRGKCSLFSVLLSDVQGMKGSRTVEGGEDTAVGELDQIVRDGGKRESVFLGNVIQTTIINAPANLATFLWSCYEGEALRRL